MADTRAEQGGEVERIEREERHGEIRSGMDAGGAGSCTQIPVRRITATAMPAASVVIAAPRLNAKRSQPTSVHHLILA
jgi:hypothetical protein